MSNALNPYQAWLDISPAEQPPDYYRLLGIRRFEADPQAIAHAAQARIALVRQKSAGSNAEITEWLISQITAARTCLMGAGSRDAYNRALLARHAGAAAKGEPRPAENVPRSTHITNATGAPSPVWQRQLVVMAAVAASVVVAGTIGMIYAARSPGKDAKNSPANAVLAARTTERETRDQAAMLAQTPKSLKRGGNREEASPATSMATPARTNTLWDDNGAGHAGATPAAETAAPATRLVAGGASVVGSSMLSNAETAAITEAPKTTPEKPTTAIDETKSHPPADASPSASEAPSAPSWLRTNENGEPCEATLADGKRLKLDTYGDSYMAFRAAPPVNGAEVAHPVLDYQAARLGGGKGAYFLRLDVAGKKMYWIEAGPSGECKILSAGLNGRSPRVLLDLRFQAARALAIDHERGKVYWGNNAQKEAAFGRPPDARRAIWRANLDGSNPEPLFGGLTEPGGIAVEPASGHVFYFDGPRLISGAPDGRNESVVLDRTAQSRAYKAFNAAIHPKQGDIYWSSSSTYIARASLDGTRFDVPYDGGGHILGVGVGVQDDKVYWADSPGMVWRANLDCSQPETIAVGMEQPSSIDVDSEHGYVYWTDLKIAGAEKFAVIRRLKVPPAPVAETTPAPPLVSSVDPSRQVAGGKIQVRGGHFSRVKHVRVIGDDGEQSDAQFKVITDGEMDVVLPRRREGVKRVAIVVDGPGGVTVTLPRDTHSVVRSDKPFTNYDRFRDGTNFCFSVEPDAAFAHVEHSIVYVPARARCFAGGRGNAVLFLKDGSATSTTDASGVVIYHEPFARILRATKASGDHKYVPVPAIRPSFLESVVEYIDKE